MKCSRCSCESCRTKLRSYRGLLTHLHTCSKVPRVKPKATDAAPPLVTAGLGFNLTPVATTLDPPQLDSKSKPQEMTVQSPSSDSFVPQTAATVLSSQDGRPGQQQQHKKAAPDLPSRVGLAAAMELPDSQDQSPAQNRFPTLAPKSSSGSSAIWKKNQGRNLMAAMMHLCSCAGVLKPAIAALYIYLKGVGYLNSISRGNFMDIM